MIMKANKQIGFIYKDNESIDKILKDGEVVFERGFLREKTSTTLPITFGGVGKDLKDYKIYGNTYQNSTSGKNLFDKNNFIEGYIDSSGVYHTDSSIKANALSDYIKIDNNTDYIFSAKNNIYGLNFALYDSNKVFIKRVTSNNTSYNQINSETANYCRVWCNISQQTNITSELIEEYEVQLEEGSIATPYEPYTGGQPSPNPDYPQEIVSCGDRTKNLFDKDTTNVLNAYFDSSHINITADTTNKVIYLPCKPSTTYSITQGVSSLSNHLLQIGTTNTKPEIGTTTYSFEDHRNDLTFTYITNSTAKYIIIRLRNGDYTDSTYMSTVQLEENSISTSYEPYGYKIPINVRSDNLFDKDNANILNATFSNDGKTLTSSQNGRTLYIKCKPNTTYTIIKKARERFRLLTTTILPSVGVIGNNYTFGDTESTLAITTTSNDNYLCVYYYLYNTDTLTEQQILDSIMIVEGSTAPSKYIPYYNETTNIYLDEPLRKIDGYSDNIDFKSGKVVRNIDEVILDGSETYYGGGSGTGSPDYTYVYTKVFDSLAISGVCPIFSSHFATIKGNMARGTVVSIDTMCIDKSTSTDRTRFLILTSRLSASTPSAFKTWLTTNNTTVDYVLATPTEESITLPNIPTIDGNNTLNIKTEITPSQVYIKYKSNT